MNEENIINSDISPAKMSELNLKYAKQFDIALGVIVNDFPSKIIAIKNNLDSIRELIQSLKTFNLNFNLDNEFEDIVKNYDTFSQNVENNSCNYEIQLLNIINIFDKQNNFDGTSTINNDYFKKLPYLGTMLYTFATYFGNGNYVDDFPQLALDASGIYMDRDFNESIGNIIYNAAEYFGENLHWPHFLISTVGATGLISFELLYDYLYVDTNKEQLEMSLIDASVDGTKLILGNLIADYIATPFGTAVSEYLVGYTGLQALGTIAGGVVGIGVVVLSEIAMDKIIDPIVDELTGESFIKGTSIRHNGGAKELYSNYVNSAKHFYSSYLGNTIKINDITVSFDYYKALLQDNPIDATITYLGSDHFRINEVERDRLENYINELKSIPKDSLNFEDKVNELTSLYSIYSNGTENYINDILTMGFDPYTYALNN